MRGRASVVCGITSVDGVSLGVASYARIEEGIWLIALRRNAPSCAEMNQAPVQNRGRDLKRVERKVRGC